MTGRQRVGGDSLPRAHLIALCCRLLERSLAGEMFDSQTGLSSTAQLDVQNSEGSYILYISIYVYIYIHINLYNTITVDIIITYCNCII